MQTERAATMFSKNDFTEANVLRSSHYRHVGSTDGRQLPQKALRETDGETH
jgi:hypothetical protein